jgi:hypothetical protein
MTLTSRRSMRAISFAMLGVAGDGLRPRILEACLDIGTQGWLVGLHG